MIESLFCASRRQVPNKVRNLIMAPNKPAPRFENKIPPFEDGKAIKAEADAIDNVKFRHDEPWEDESRETEPASKTKKPKFILKGMEGEIK